MQVKSKWSILFLIWVMLLIAYFDRIDIAIAGPKIMAALHLTRAQFGWALSAFTFGYALMQIPGGHFADKIGSRPLLVAAILVWSVFTVLTGFAVSLVTLIAIRILFGFGEGIEIGPQFKLIGDYFTVKERSQANSFFLSAIALGPAIATPIATKLIVGLGWRAMFVVFAIPGFALAVVLALMLPRKAPESPANPALKEDSGLRASLRAPAPWFCAAAYLLFNVALWGFLSWIPSYLTTQRHLTLANMGLAGSLPYDCGFLGMVVIGYLGSTLLAEWRAALAGICALATAGLLYVSMSASDVDGCIRWLCATAFFLFGFFGPFWAVAVGLAAPRARGALSGFVNFWGQVGAFGGQIVVGYLADKMNSFDGALLFMSVAIGVSGIVLLGLEKLRRGGSASFENTFA